MKRKFLLIVLTLASVLCMAFALAACSWNSGNGGETGNGSHTQQGGTQGGEQGGGSSETDNKALRYAERYGVDGKTVIGYAVIACTALNESEIVIPDTHLGLSVVAIESGAFQYCYNLRKIFIPASVTEIGEDAFSNQNNLEKIEVGEGNPNYICQDGILYNIEKTRIILVPKLLEGAVTIPAGVTEVGKSAFQDCFRITGISFEDNSKLTSIGRSAFYNCYGWKGELKLPSGVTEIGERAFYYCYGLTGALEIPSGVTEIGEGTFYECYGLQSVSFGENSELVTIGKEAFCYCYGLTGAVEIPSGVTEIGERAFYNCYRLTGVSLDKSSQLTSFGSEAFNGCYGLMEMTIPSGVTEIGNGAFENCYKLIEVWNYSRLKIQAGDYDFGEVACYAKQVYGYDTPSKKTMKDGYIFYEEEEGSYLLGYNGTDTELNLPEQSPLVRRYAIYPYAFYHCDLFTGGLTIPYAVSSIGEYAFYYCSGLTGVSIADNSQILSIERGVFQGCSGLTSVSFGRGSELTSIEEYAFESCSGLTEVTIPVGVASIGTRAFCNCSGLTEIIIPESVTYIGGNAFYETAYYHDDSHWADDIFYLGDWLIMANETFSGSASVRDGTRAIAASAFKNCSGLTEVTIPEGVVTIGSEAFSGCSGLKEVTIPSSMTEIGRNAFYQCNGLKKVHIADLAAWCKLSFRDFTNNPLTTAHHLYMDGEEITTLTIPRSVTSIGEGIFAGCSCLTKVVIPDSVISIGGNAFNNCVKLIEVWNYSGLEIQEGESRLGGVAFYAKHVYTDDTPSKQTVVNDYIFYEEGEESYLLGYNGTETALTLPAKSPAGKNYAIYQNAFSYCSGLTSVDIPGSVTSIGDSAFTYCSGLTKITIGKGVPRIEDTAFWGCSGLTEITIPDSVTEIGRAAFADCSGLTEVTIPDSVTEIGNMTFSYCSALTKVTIGKGVTKIGDNAFSYCSALTEITIPDSVTEIGWGTFYGCSGLKGVHFEHPAGWKVIKNTDASNVTAVTGLEDPETAARYLTDTYYNYYWKREG